jgi:hypothetical protein
LVKPELSLLDFKDGRMNRELGAPKNAVIYEHLNWQGHFAITAAKVYAKWNGFLGPWGYSHGQATCHNAGTGGSQSGDLDWSRRDIADGEISGAFARRGHVPQVDPLRNDDKRITAPFCRKCLQRSIIIGYGRDENREYRNPATSAADKKA